MPKQHASSISCLKVEQIPLTLRGPERGQITLGDVIIKMHKVARGELCYFPPWHIGTSLLSCALDPLQNFQRLIVRLK